MPRLPQWYVGVDVGFTGGLVILDKEGRIYHKMIMPVREDRTIDSLKLKEIWYEYQNEDNWKLSETPAEDAVVACEKVWGFKGQGISSTFNFGRNTGQTIGALELIFEQQVLEFSPQTWQRDLLNLSGTEKDPKKAAREYVESTFNGENFLATKRSKKPHQGMVDACCIASYIKNNIGLYK